MLLFFDPTQRISKVDKQLCDYIAEQYKPCIFVVNKWDLMADGMPTESWVGYLRDTFRTMWYVPIAFITGQTGKNVKALLNHAQMLFKQAIHRVTTGELNRVRAGRAGSESAAAVSKPHARRFFTPRKSAPSRRRSCCFAAIRRRCRSPIAAICWACFAISCRFPKCRSSSICESAKTPATQAVVPRNHRPTKKRRRS